jgi:hypothetical protein
MIDLCCGQRTNAFATSTMEFRSKPAWQRLINVGRRKTANLISEYLIYTIE